MHWWEFAVWLRKLKRGLCINLEGWDGEGEGTEVQKGGDICIPMADSCEVWQKTTKFCKAIILQLKQNKTKQKMHCGQDFPGDPLAKTLCSQCRGPRFNP